MIFRFSFLKIQAHTPNKNVHVSEFILHLGRQPADKLKFITMYTNVFFEIECKLLVNFACLLVLKFMVLFFDVLYVNFLGFFLFNCFCFEIQSVYITKNQNYGFLLWLVFYRRLWYLIFFSPKIVFTA